jgi:[ribosomal protein S5]-alanine N-acetyltransferase
MYPVNIRGDTIELRELDEQDAAAVAAIIGDEAVLKYTTWKGPTDFEAAGGFIRLAQETAAASPRIEYILAITDLGTGKVFGTGGIRVEDEAGEVGSLRVLLRRDWWGRGAASEAAKLGIAFGFDTLGLIRIEADPAAENAAAHKVLEKVGMRRLELRPGHHLSPSGRRDSVGYAMDREDAAL